MLITELGVATTLLIGFSFGIVGFILLAFWIKLIFPSFNADSKLFWPLFWIHLIAWVVGFCIVPYGWLNDSVGTWGWPFMIIFLGSIFVRAIVYMIGRK